MAEFLGDRNNKFILKNISPWVNEVNPIAKRFDLDVLELMYWEQRIGNWCASSGADLDIAIEHVYPFNCRELLETLLSVDKKYRKYPKYTLYKMIIKKLWPELLKEPINPITISKRLKDLIMIFFVRIRIYYFLKRNYGKIKSILINKDKY